MLNIQFGDMPEAVRNPSTYFNNVYKDEWITSTLGREIILSVDKSVVLDPNTIESPAFGRMIKPIELSGGTKTLLLMAYDSRFAFNATACGDNCAKWILKIAEEKHKRKKKLLINLRYLMDFGDGDFDIRIVNTNRIVHNMREMILEAGELV